ncbi:trichohyalin-like [Branchiostoma lanceolatum]|uniref:trichohyalin-like n=1 Tax=Branchiostoma lanceolatum TaxID=7740 RepID=UPI003456AFDD
MYERQELRQEHPDFQVPTPPTEPKTVAQREKAMQRQARNSRRKLRMAPQVPSQGVSDQTMDSCEEADRHQPHPDFQVPTPPTEPKTVAQREKDMQRQTRKSRRNLRKAPQVHSQGINNPVMDSCEEADLRLAHPDFQVPTPSTKPKTVDHREKDMQRQTRKSRQNLHRAPQVLNQGINDPVMDSCEEADLRLKAGHRPSYVPPGGFSENMPNRYVRNSPTWEERDRALDEHAERIFHQKVNTMMFGEDLSASKLPSKRRSKKVRAPEKIRQLEQERHNAVPFDDEHQLLRVVCTTVMFGDDLSQTRRIPAQSSLVGGRHTRIHDAEGLIGAPMPRSRYQNPEPENTEDQEDAVYITMEDLDYRANRLKQAADISSERTDSQIPTPPTKPKTVDQREKDMQRQTRNSRRNLRKAPQVHSVSTEEERDRALDKHADFQVPTSPPKTVAQREKDMQRRTCNSRRNLRKAPPVPSQGVSDQAMDPCEEADHPQAHPDFQIFSPRTKPKTVDQREKDMQRQTHKSRRNLRKAPQVHCESIEEERDRALDEHADFQVPTPPPKTVAQQEKDMQRRTCNSRQNLRKAPPVPSQGVSDQTMDPCEEADRRQAHPDFQIFSPRTKPKTVAQREKDMQRQTRNSRRNLRKAPQAHSVNTEEERDRALDEHADFQVPTPPPKTVAQREKDMQRQTRSSRRNLRKAPPVPSQGISDQAMDSCEEADRRQAHPDFQVPTPSTKPKTVAQREKDMQRQTRKSRRNLRKAPQDPSTGISDQVMESCEEADLRLKAGQRPSYVPPEGFSDNMPNRYVRNSPTEEERDRALDEHAERIFHQKVNTMMFGEDLSTSKLPSKRRSKKVRAPEKIHQLEQERHNAVPFDDEHQLLRVVCTTVMFGDDLSQTRRIPAQSSLVGGRHTRIHDAQGLIGAPMPRSRYQNPEPEPDEDQEDAEYITMEDLDYRANRLKQEADMEVSSERTATKLSSPAPQRHTATLKRTATDDNISGHSLPMHPQPPVAAKSDNAVAAEKLRYKRAHVDNISGHSLLMHPQPPVAAKSDNAVAAEKLSSKRRAHRRAKDARALKRRYDDPSGPVRGKH